MPTHTGDSVQIDGLTFAYDERVLQPRPWTALQSAWAVELLEQAPPGPVLELCTGAGHIGLLCIARTARTLVAVDLEPAACSFARLNAAAAGLADRVEVRQSALVDAVHADERFVVVLADPPWVRSADLPRYPDDPRLAIDGGPAGLGVATQCVHVASRCLVPGGHLLLQLGTDLQADAVVAEALDSGAWTDGGRRHGERGVVLRLDRTAY